MKHIRYIEKMLIPKILGYSVNIFSEEKRFCLFFPKKQKKGNKVHNVQWSIVHISRSYPRPHQKKTCIVLLKKFVFTYTTTRRKFQLETNYRTIKK